jgi:hypothetical protein
MMTGNASKRRRRLTGGVGALILALSTSLSFGQAKYTATGPGTYINVGATVSGFESDYGKQKLGGGALFVDANLYRKIGVEFEGRRLQYNNDEDLRESTYLVGPKYSFKGHRLRPYAKFLVGRGHINFPFNYATGSYFAMAPGGGLDYRVGRSRLSIRVIDFEYQIWPQFTFGPLHPYGANVGLSYQVFGPHR